MLGLGLVSSQDQRLKCNLCGSECGTEGLPTLQEVSKTWLVRRYGRKMLNPCLRCGTTVDLDHIPDLPAYQIRVQKCVSALNRIVSWRNYYMDHRHWPASVQNLAGTEWDGHCPAHPDQEMYLNIGDFFECPMCRLQIATADRVYAVGLRGIGDFKERHGRRISAVDTLPGISSFTIAQDLRVNS